MINRIKTNLNYIINSWIKCMSLVFSMIGAISIFIPINEYINGIKNAVIILLAIVFFTFLSAVIAVFVKNKNDILCKNGKKVTVEFGDILSEKYESNKKIIAISANRCFDTEVNNGLISSDKLHGKVIKKIEEKENISQEALNKKIQKILDKQNLCFEQLNKEEKRLGNLKRYPVGTVVEYNLQECNYYLLGLCKLDENLHEQYTEQDQISVIQKLIEHHNVYGNGKELILPIIGGGNTGPNKSEQTILELMVQLIKFNENFINSNIHIVVRKSAKNEINILEL